jgi:hypothetical protein
VAAPRGLDPDDDLALTSDRLGNLVDDERPRDILDDPGPASSPSQPFEPAACAQGWPSARSFVFLPAFRRSAAQTSGCPPIRCGRLPTPARVSDTSDVTGSALSRPWSIRLAPPIPRRRGACCSGGSLPSSGHGLRSPTWAHCVKWSQTPRPRQVRELLFVVLAGSPEAAARGPRRGRRPAGPRRRDRSGRPRLARRATRGGCDDLTDAEAAAARGPAAVAGGTATHAGGAPHPCGVAAAQQPGACWACRGSTSPGHGSRVAAALASLAGKRRRADRAGGDLW